MLDAVSRLGASGGGDCPELAMTALLAAIEASQHGSTIYLFTDASAKDSNLVENVVAAATEKDISITVASSGSCSPVDPAYRTMTQSTGGQLLIHGHSEVETAKLFDLLRPTLAGDLETILLAEVEVGAATGFDVPIDSTVSAATIAIGHEGGATVQVLRPDGTEAVPSDPAVTRTDLTGTTVINLEGPEPGTWRLLVSGSAGPVTVSVKGNSPIRFDEFTPVALTEDARHEGLFPLVGASLTGKEVEARAMVLGPVSNAGFELRSPSGELLETIDLELAGSEYVAADQHFGTFLPGEGPYRVYATGTDAAGHRVLRAFPGVTRSQPIEVTAERLPSAAPADIDTTALFRITNHGAARELLVTAADSLRSVRDVTPTTVELESGESAQVEVTMRVPAGTPDRTPFQLTVVATDTTDPEITNHTVVDLAVGSELPVACLVVDLSGTRLVGREGGVNETPAIPVDLPDGTYTITLESNDPVHGNPAQRTQPDERWVLEGLDAAGDVVLTIGPTSDIPDDQNTVIDIVGEHEMIGVVAVRARHAAPSEQYNSVEPGSARFERIGCSHSPEPAPGSRGTNPEP
jgi:hypothetical protein